MNTHNPSGLVTQASAGQSDGSLTVYRLEVEDSLALLKRRRQSRVFLDQSIVDITQVLFDEWCSLSPLFNSTIGLDRSKLQADYPKISFTQQHNETDYAFVTRLWAKYGISYWVEAEQATAALSMLGQNTSNLKQRLVLIDAPSAIEKSTVNRGSGTVNYKRNAATEKFDTLNLLVARRQLTSGLTSSSHWDASSSSTIRQNNEHTGLAGSAGSTSATLDDVLMATPKHMEDTDTLHTLDNVRNQYHALSSKWFDGQSSIRNLEVGRWFMVDGHPELDRNHDVDERSMVVHSLHIAAENNLPKTLLKHSNDLLKDSSGQDWQSFADDDYNRYKNRMTVVRKGTPIVANPADYPSPSLSSIIGVVVGPEGEEVHCDEHYRIKISFAHLRAEQHAHQGGRGTSLTDGDSAWVPVSTALAGHNFGHVNVPRVGQTVIVSFFNGDPDRPYVSGVLYDGTHAPAQFSHTGSLPNNRYVSGIVSKEIKGERTNQLRFDDTPEQLSAQLQSDHAQSQLNLGNLRHPRDGEAVKRGDGAELITNDYTAIRAGKGLYVSSHGQADAKGDPMDAHEAKANLSQSGEQMKAHSEFASQMNADKLNAATTLLDCVEAMLDGKGDGQTVASFSKALLVIASPDDMALSSAANLHQHAAKALTQSSGGDTNMGVGGDWSMVINKAMSLMVSAGIKLFSGKGKIELQAQNGPLDMIARAGLSVVSTEDSIVITAAKKISINVDGVELLMEGGNVTLTMGGVLDIKGMVKTGGGGNKKAPLPLLPTAPTPYSNQIDYSILTDASSAAESESVAEIERNIFVINKASKRLMKTAQSTDPKQGSSMRFYGKGAESFAAYLKHSDRVDVEQDLPDNMNIENEDNWENDEEEES